MSMLHFTDGVSINTSGPLRIIHLRDGYYVVGEGLLCPVNDPTEGEEMIRQFKGEDK